VPGDDARRAFALSHTIRGEILALLAKDSRRSLDPDKLRHELSGRPIAAVVRYHLTVLGSAHGLPQHSSTPTDPPNRTAQAAFKGAVRPAPAGG